MNSFSPFPVVHAFVQRTFWVPVAFFSTLAGLHAQPVTNVRLPAPARGAAAISAIGEHLPVVAKAYGLEAQGLVTLLQTQPSLGVDIDGALLFVCDGLAASEKEQHSGAHKPDANDAVTATSSTMTLVNGGS